MVAKQTPAKKGKGRPARDKSLDTRRSRVTLTLPTAEIALFQQWADGEKLELATHLARLCRKGLEGAIADGSFVPSSISADSSRVSETEALLKGFLRCLADNWDTDGYSLAAVGQIIGFDGNAELDRLVEALEQLKGVDKHESSRNMHPKKVQA